jgi:anhydro-N-acetylmuramic acid kinase
MKSTSTTRIVLGLNSGTSADGVDAVACAITGRGLRMKVRLLGHVRRDYPPSLRLELLAVMAPAACRTEQLCRLETQVGLAFAEAAVLAKRRLGLPRVDLIGSHGQTICHLPPDLRRPRRTPGGTMQIGGPAIMALRLDAPVVSHFRHMDMAAGGQGAPLVPWTDYVLFADRRVSRVVQNVGGIANLTWLPAGGGLGDVQAFDCGPGNMLIDGLVRHFSRGRMTYDRRGRWAARGIVRSELLQAMLRHPFLSQRPPKSCGREQFGEPWMRRLLARFGRRRFSPADWLATATFFTAASLMLGYAHLAGKTPRGRRSSRLLPMDEIVLCGGGAKNATLALELHRCLAAAGGNAEITTTARYGIPVDAKEGVSFAMLAAAHEDGVAANLPWVTGARRGVILGQRTEAGGRR